MAEAQANRKLVNRRYVIPDKRLGRIQAIHAAALIGFSGLGSLLLVPFSFAYGVRSIDVILFVALYVLTLLGGTVGFHRLFSHRAFSAPPGVRLVLAILASMSAQGPLGYWVANHRRHHWDSDGALDPHSPHRSRNKRFGRLDGLLHAHFGWAFVPEITNGLKFGKGLAADPVARFVTRTYLVWVAAGLVIPTAIGGFWSGSLNGAAAGFLWGGLLRIFCVFNAASLINSLCHVYGKAPYPVPNYSRNIWWLSLATLGESWHNNHHAFSKSPLFGHHWWQVDIGGFVILLLRSVGLAEDLKIPDKAKLARRTKAGVQWPSATDANNQDSNVHIETGLPRSQKGRIFDEQTEKSIT